MRESCHLYVSEILLTHLSFSEDPLVKYEFEEIKTAIKMDTESEFTAVSDSFALAHRVPFA